MLLVMIGKCGLIAATAAVSSAIAVDGGGCVAASGQPALANDDGDDWK